MVKGVSFLSYFIVLGLNGNMTTHKFQIILFLISELHKGSIFDGLFYHNFVEKIKMANFSQIVKYDRFFKSMDNLIRQGPNKIYTV